MDSPPLSHQSEPRSGTKSASRLTRTGEIDQGGQERPKISLDLSTLSPSKTLSPSNPLPLHELLLLSPSPLRRSRTRLTERIDMGEEPLEATGSRRRCKSRISQMGVLGCASPRNARRPRRRVEQDVREDKDFGMAEEMGKLRKRRHSGRSRKEKLSLVPSVPSSSSSPKANEDDLSNLHRIGQLVTDLIMWKDASKSTFWFGFGSVCFLSSCFTRGISFSIFSAISQLGLLFLGLSFFSNSLYQRDNVEKRREFKLKEDDILRVARAILPATNLAISKTIQLFSGEPSMTLKVAPFFLVGAEYGHLLTVRRLCALGFFISFTIPKLYSCYSAQINTRVEYLKGWVVEAWGACSHKKIVAASAVTVFWNLSAIKTRIFAAFISLVILRYHRQQSEANMEEREAEGEEKEQQQQPQLTMVVGGGGGGGGSQK
ncbi:reticulon-like protein B17 [Vitis riparia]|uniref:reticulon-like protein B17 n=1 Tax=Vitis riparia TaxID=96939 RepID=UPI00155AA864|nr:reticulon-like protein B17 [Vitis riparia]